MVGVCRLPAIMEWDDAGRCAAALLRATPREQGTGSEQGMGGSRGSGLVRPKRGSWQGEYDQAAELQRWVGGALLENLVYAKVPPGRILDLGCGTGFFTRALKRRFPRSLVVGLDLAEGMLAAARRRQGWLRRFRLIQGDALCLPFVGGAFDLVYSNLLAQWIDEVSRLFSEIRRVLAPQGLLVFSTLGPETLAELREALGAEEASRRVHPFLNPEALGAKLLELGFDHPVLERELIIRRYPSLKALAAELKALGASNARSDRPRGVPGKHWLRGLRERFEARRDETGFIAVRWEAVIGLAFAPPTRRSERGAGPIEVFVPAERIPVRRKPG